MVQPGPYTDIFALGATLLALTGLMIDDDITRDTVLARCPYTNDIKIIISRMIAHDHLKRYQNCRDVVDDIKKTQTGDSPLPVISPSSIPPLGGTVLKVGRTKTVEIDKEVLHLEGHKSPLVGIFEIADGRIISFAFGDGTFKIWDTKTGQCTTTINGAGIGICFALLSDGTIASGGANNSIQISDIKGQIAKCLRERKGHKNAVKCIIECSDGT